jgi:hypothetical protein
MMRPTGRSLSGSKSSRWGESFRDAKGKFRYSADINREQYQHACMDAGNGRWRLELVAMLAIPQSIATARLPNVERLTLTSQDLLDGRTTARKYKVSLEGLEGRIRYPWEQGG